MNCTVACLFAALLLNVSCKERSQNRSGSSFDLRIVYNVLDKNDSLDYEIYWMDLDGSHSENLTQSTSVDWCVHSTGEKIYFLSDRDTSRGFYHLFEMIPSTRQVRKIYEGCVLDSWIGSRKNGKEFVICVQQEDGRSLLIIDSTGKKLHEVLKTSSYRISDPTFSPDGQFIIFRSDKGGNEELWRIDILGIEERQLTSIAGNDSLSGKYYQAGPPHWVPDSNIITFTSRQGNNYDILKIDPNGNQLSRITSTLDFNEGWHNWSPEADLIVLDGGSTDATNYDIYLMRADGTKRIQLTHSPKYEHAPVFVKFYSKS